ncbi:TPA: hypothetical protein QHP34_004811, partial [Citrobacter braakii]|nr:hypothetical protein [Citrobacter braakii]
MDKEAWVGLSTNKGQSVVQVEIRQPCPRRASGVLSAFFHTVALQVGVQVMTSTGL